MINYPDKQIVFTCFYHVVWCVKYRRYVLTGEVRDRLEVLIKESCEEYGIHLISLEIFPEHVYLHVDVDPRFGVHKAIKSIKARTSHILREEFSQLRSRLPTLWTNSYFVSTLDCGVQDAIQTYIDGQPRW